MIEELSPESFLWELYDAGGLYYLSDTGSLVECAVGYCDASRLLVRPRLDEYALMCELPDGQRLWFHISGTILEYIRRRQLRNAEGHEMTNP